MNVVVGGYAVPFPSAGLFWHYAQYALGFQALGHDVWYVEDSTDHPWGWDHERNDLDPGCRYGVAFVDREMAALGLDDRWVFRHAPTGHHAGGMDADTTAAVLAEADVLVNVTCALPPRPEYSRIPCRIGIDTDPVFTQVKTASGHPHWSAVPEFHTRLFTFGRPPLPAQAHDWLPTRQPVSIDHWTVGGPGGPGDPVTTVTAWQTYPPVEWEGRYYGTKGDSLRSFVDLPASCGRQLLVALGPGAGQAEGAALLQAHGWDVVDGTPVSSSSQAYREFMHGSLAELGFAKHGYVMARSGWFSERTCAYLASGRAAVVQDTGWTDWLPAGKGLFAFRTAEQAAAAIEAVAEDPAGHGAAARRLVAEHFDAADVCAELLEAAL